MLAVFRVRDGEGPVVAVAAHGADDLLLGHDLENPLQVADEPVLAGHRPRFAVGLVLVVVHQHNAVGVGGDQLELVVRASSSHVDIKPQIARVHAGIQFLNEGQVSRFCVVVEAFDVQRKAGIVRKCSEEPENLLAQRRALVLVPENVAYTRVPGLGARIVVVQVGKDFGIFPGCLDDPLDLAHTVGVMDRSAPHHWIFVEIVAGHRHQRSRGSIHVEPLREKNVDLVDVLLKR